MRFVFRKKSLNQLMQMVCHSLGGNSFDEFAFKQLTSAARDLITMWDGSLCLNRLVFTFGRRHALWKDFKNLEQYIERVITIGFPIAWNKLVDRIKNAIFMMSKLSKRFSSDSLEHGMLLTKAESLRGFRSFNQSLLGKWIWRLGQNGEDGVHLWQHVIVGK